MEHASTLNRNIERAARLQRRVASALLRRAATALEYDLVAKNAPKGGGYIDAKSIVEGAARAQQSICEYVEELWGQKGATESVLSAMADAGCMRSTDRVCEVGPGTGRYLERVLRTVKPRAYDYYETAEDWAAWLAQTYPATTRQPTDGKSLASTPSATCGLVHAHGVFVYLPVLQSFEYFTEMARVCAPGGDIVFDFYADVDFGVDTVRRWLAAEHRYAVVLPRATVVDYFGALGFRLAAEFDRPHGQGRSRYLVLRRS